MKCYLHNEAEAVGTCIQCGKGLCPDCALNVNGKIVCRECAAMPAESVLIPPQRKDPFIAAVLSIIGGILTGSLLFSLGQLYNGQIKKFIVLTLVNLFMGGIVAALYLGGSLLTVGVGILCCLPVFLLPLFIYLYEVYDAYVTASKLNRGELVCDWF